MTALADALWALMPYADAENAIGHEKRPARDVLRKHAPCLDCKGKPEVVYSHECPECKDAGWTPASVEAAIALDVKLRMTDAAVIDAAEEVNRWAGPGHPLMKNLALVIEQRRERQPR